MASPTTIRQKWWSGGSELPLAREQLAERTGLPLSDIARLEMTARRMA